MSDFKPVSGNTKHQFQIIHHKKVSSCEESVTRSLSPSEPSVTWAPLCR